MSNRSRNAAMLGAEKPQNLDGFGVSDDAGNGFPTGRIGGLSLGAGLCHDSGHELTEFGRDRDRAGAKVVGCFAGLSRRKATIFASLGHKGSLGVVVHSNRIIQEAGRQRIGVALAPSQTVVEGCNLSRRHLLDHLILRVEPIPTMGKSYTVTSYNATTVRRLGVRNDH